LKNFELYKKLVPSDKLVDAAIESCKSNKNFVANKTKHVIVNQAAINKKEFDMAPMFADRKETKLFFASSRMGSTGDDIDPISCQNYMDIWVSEIDKKGNWGEPKLIDNSGLINTPEHEGSVTFDGRGKTMFFTRCPNMKKHNLGCDIWVSEMKGKDEWSEPKKLNLKTNDSITVGHPCVSDDGKFLIFASDMPGGFGGKDLWYTTFDKKNDSWTTPKNLGPEINTKGNELFPTFGKDGSLFFASDGLVGMGGLDLFKAAKVGEEMKWEDPKNLGTPINSESNDYALYELTEVKGYFTSERKSPSGQFNPDIYKYELPPDNYDLKVIVGELGDKNVRLSDVKVVVKGSDGSTWEGYTKDGISPVWTKKPDGTRYVNKDVSYSISISKEGYLEDKKGAKFTTVGLTTGQNFIIEMNLLPIKPILLPEVRYPLNQWTLLVDQTINSPDSLLIVYNTLEDYPNIVLELSSHTDSRGKDDANQKLSENRARACYKYLVEQKGVDPRRIVPVGKGETEPRTIWKKGTEYLVSKPTDMNGVESIQLTEKYIEQFKTTDNQLYEKLHQYNRRTEARILKTDFNPATAPAADPNYLKFVKYP
jgi:peptidoglycan-associated lipoprotein